MKIKVAILGGGVAGMSAAHELIERGFDVEVYERQPRYVGGKARSVDVEDTAIDGRKPLPGEHGFRFFPGFYKHITDTMKRIPFGNNPNGVFDNLVMTERVMMARFGKAPIQEIVNFPKNLADLRVAIDSITKADMGLSEANKKVFAEKIWQLLTSSYERRQQVYERIGWWEYMQTDQQCEGQSPCAYEEYCVGGLTHSLVAAQPKLMSTKTGGDILLQLLLLMADPTGQTDRILNGPTNDVWLFPWLNHLTDKGVQYFHHHEVEAFVCDPQTRLISGATVRDLTTNQVKTVGADYYISAVPLERMVRLINAEMLAIDNTFDYLWHLHQIDHAIDLIKTPNRPTIVDSLNWMNGIQYFLNQDVPLTKGHVIFIDSPWAVTAISQAQFWPHFDLSQCYNGEVKGVLSVDVSDWFNAGLNGKKAKDCTLDEIIEEVWDQMEKSLNIDGQVVLNRSMIVKAHVDCDITEDAQKKTKVLGNHFASAHNDEPLLVNVANTWSNRPEAATEIQNFFLASDYVRTNTDLATMEGANEAARRAANGIIARSGANVPYCRIWPLHEPDILAVLRWQDKRRYEKGLPWTNELPWMVRLLHDLNYWFHRLFGVK